MKSVFVLLAGAAVAASLSAGCTRAQAKATLEPPPLNVPMPPPRVVEPAVVEAAAPPPPEQEPVADVTPPRPATPPPTRVARPPETKPTEPVETAVKPEDAPRPATPPLQTLPSKQESQEEEKIRTALRAANDNLGKVEPRSLGTNARNQYEIAKGLIKQAEDALKAKNLVFARSLADRAATLAAQLAPR